MGWLVWALVALFLLGLAIYELKNVLTPIFLAFLIAYLLDPLEALPIGGAELADRLGEAGGRRLASPRDLLAGALAAADDVVEELLGPIARPGRRLGRRREGLLDRASQRFPDRFRRGRGRLSAGFAHAPSLGPR